MSESAAPTASGRRTVGAIVASALVIAAGFGYVVGTVLRNDAPGIGLLGFEFSPTPLNMAAYGFLAMFLIFAVIYALLAVVSKYDADAVE
ncbi:MAG: hypothetical protein ABEJ31_11030 [Haloarculaceae archaeon]